MRMIVIYESMYGNTQAIAEAIAQGLSEQGDVTVVPVDQADPSADLLVLGAPTHMHGLPTRMSRSGVEEEAKKRQAAGEPIEYHATAGMRMLIADLPRVDGTPAACFDTRFDKSTVLTGSAAKTTAKKLQRLGYRLVTPPESFFVLDSEGPLKDGELERARSWGRSIAAEVNV